ncbi:YbfB/YjiJ family MFS transporter [Stappia stellulata]|uniref:YbfB/YjiJ family MFS transporter n=1 Tax=Stappia stellulata TaxID=71235 RepID=UPI0004108534|nr:YbfB/YjiJ family MFS transporter [Stappia stellulata]
MTVPGHGDALRLAFGGLCALAVAMGIGRFALTPILPAMSGGIPLSASQAGMIASANFLGYLLGALAAMSVSRSAVHAGFRASLLASVGTTAAMAMNDGPVFLAFMRFLGGVVSAGVLVFSSTLVLERLARMNRAGLAALHFAGVGVGIALSAVLVGGLARGGIAWQGQWIGSGALAALLCAGAWICLVLPDEPLARQAAEAGAAQQSSRRAARPSPALVRLAAAYALFGIGYVVTATFLTSILRAAPTLAVYETPAWAAVGLSAAASVWIWGRVAARLGGMRAFSLACAMEAVGVAASVLVPGVSGAALAAVLLGGTFMGITSLGLVEARRLSGGDPKTVLGLMTACFGLGQMLGPTLAGYAADLTGSFFWPSLCAASLLVVAALLTLRPARA